MAISAKIRTAMEAGSWIRQMFELGIELKKRYGDDQVFDLSLGNPVLDPPIAFTQELKRLVQESTTGMHRYMPNAGYPHTRAAIAEYLSAQTGLPFEGTHVVMTCGAGGALNVALKALLDPGDEVIIFTPYFPEYPAYIDNHMGIPIITSTDQTFQPDLESLHANITGRTKGILVNSPNNPSGAVYGQELMEGVGRILRDKEREFGSCIYLISDEPYARLTYDSIVNPSIFQFHEASIVATSFSKDLSLPGERIGYLATNPNHSDSSEVVDAWTFCNRTLGYVNAPALMQRAVVAILNESVDIKWYQKRRDLVYKSLTSMGYSLIKPNGAFYAFPASPIEDDVEFVKELLKWNVLVTPGTGFGRPGYFRVSYCVEESVLEGAMEGFSGAAKVYGLPG